MNAGKMIINLVSRSYRVRRKPKPSSNPGIQKRLTVLEEGEENDIESVEDFDLEESEPDFMHVHESYDSYKKELTKNKELLKLRIVTRKYFKNVEPNLLTYLEKEQIRFLHQKDPVEYTPEKLSESFPALPYVIRKVIRAKWIPTSVDRVFKHDQYVIESWEKFNRGELPLEPRLREHLLKFKDRKITLPSKEELKKKIVLPEKNFPKPHSQLYSGIIQRYLEHKGDKNETSVPTDDAENADFKDTIDESMNDNDSMNSPSRTGKDELVSKSRYGNKAVTLQDEAFSTTMKTRSADAKGKDFLTLDDFFKERVKNIDKATSIEDRVLLDTYKRKIELKENSTNHGNHLNSKKLGAQFEESDSVTLLTNKDVQIADEKYKAPKSMKVVDDPREMGLETYVKVWEKKSDGKQDYPQSIIIPKNKYKKGKLYKLEDCYYDHDGEFMYRVPGLRD